MAAPALASVCSKGSGVLYSQQPVEPVRFYFPVGITSSNAWSIELGRSAALSRAILSPTHETDEHSSFLYVLKRQNPPPFGLTKIFWMFQLILNNLQDFLSPFDPNQRIPLGTDTAPKCSLLNKFASFFLQS